MSFQVICETDNRAIIAWDWNYPAGTRESVQPDGYTLTVIADEKLFDWLTQTVAWPPYAVLNADNQSFALVDVWPAMPGMAATAAPNPRGFVARLLNR